MMKTQKSTSRSFRIVCEQEQILAVEALLEAEGYEFEPEEFSSWCRVLTHEPKPLGRSLAALFGLIYIQDRSSMLPPLALMQDVDLTCTASKIAVLDMCASPGSKTSFLGQLVGRHGFVLGNEPSKSRLATLRANIQQLGLLQVATCTHAGESIALLPNSWQYIQLDPPCSGWGTVEKNPQVLELWQGKKINPLIELQKKLLQKAHDLLCPGGEVVYSTCTTNIDENELQVNYALEELGFELIALQPFAGFSFEDSSIAGTLRVDGARSDAQGFYIAKLRKKFNEENITPEASEINIGEKLCLSMLEGPCTDVNLLPAGQIMLFGQVARFVPDAICSRLHSRLQWQAPSLGKVMGEQIRLHAHCTMLMPAIPPKEALVVENIKDLYALIQGQSLQTALNGRETGLYYASSSGPIALGRVGLKQGRVLWNGR